MKKIIMSILIVVLIVVAMIFLIPRNQKEKISNNAEIKNTNTVQNYDISNNTIKENKVDEEMNIVYIKVNNKSTITRGPSSSTTMIKKEATTV